MRGFLISFQIIYVLAVVPWLLITVMSPMVFDSGVTAGGISFVVILLSYPIVALICSILAWRLRLKRKLASVLLNTVPILWVIAILLAMFGESLGAALSAG